MKQPFDVPKINMPVFQQQAKAGLANKQPDMFMGTDAPRYKADDSIFQSQQPKYDFSQSGMSESYFDKLAGIESQGNYQAHNAGSGAYGKYQFIPGTEKHVAGQLGLTIDQARTPENQERMIRRFTQDNIAGLKKAGVPVNNETLWYSHNLGLGSAINMHNGGRVNPRYIASNIPKGLDPTIANYVKHWSGRWA